jgi:hypothetical protein
LKAFFQEAVSEEGAVPGAVIAIQSFGDFLGFNSHLHVLSTDGCFYGQGMFRPALARLIRFEADKPISSTTNDPLLISRIIRSGPGVAPRFETKHLEEIFRHKVFKMLLSKGKITQDLVNMLMSWRHSGFNVFCGPRIQPGDQQAMENLARYIIRASFSQERMTYIPEESKACPRSRSGNGKEEKDFDALEWPRQEAGCKHSLACVLMCQTRENRWSGIMAIIVMFHEASGKKKIRITSTFHPGARRIIKRVPKELGKIDSKDL